MPILRHIDTPTNIPRTDSDGNRIPDQYLPVWEVIIGTVRGGNTHEDAALYAGISPSTLSVWIKRGLDELTRLTTNNIEEPPDKEKLYVNLALEIGRADAASRVAIVSDWRRQMRRDWRAADRFMAKRYGGPWADKSQIDVGLSGTVELGVSLGGPAMSHAEAEQLKSELEARDAALAALESGDVLDVEEVREVVP